MVKISVIVPSYRPSTYIMECIYSVYEQSLSKELYEIIVVLNGDKEPYYSDILNYVNKIKIENLKLIYTEVRGVSNARNIGLQESEGEYIVFLDDDDLLDERYLELCLDNIKNTENTIVSVESENFNNKYRDEKLKIESDIIIRDYNIFNKRNTFSVVWGTLIPRKIIGKIKFNLTYKNGEDSLFMVQISKNITNIKALEGIILHYRRIRNNSAAFSKKSYKYVLKNNFGIIKEHLKLLINNEYSKKFIILRILVVLKGTVYELARNFRLNLKK